MVLLTSFRENCLPLPLKCAETKGVCHRLCHLLGNTCQVKGSLSNSKVTLDTAGEKTLGQKCTCQRWRTGSDIKNTDSSYRKPGFCSQNPHDSFQWSVTPVWGDPVPSGLRGPRTHSALAYMQVKDIYTYENFK